MVASLFLGFSLLLYSQLFSVRLIDKYGLPCLRLSRGFICRNVGFILYDESIISCFTYGLIFLRIELELLQKILHLEDYYL